MTWSSEPRAVYNHYGPATPHGTETGAVSAFADILFRKSRKATGEPPRPRSWLRFLVTVVVAACLFLAGVASGLFLPQPEFAKEAVREVRALHQQMAARDAGDTRQFPFETVDTGLHTLELARIPVGTFVGGGGAMALVGNDVLFADPRGYLGYLHPGSHGTNYEIRHLAAIVPMNRPALLKSEFASDPEFIVSYFRTLELLPVRRADGRLDLYVSHHRYADHCIQFVVSRAPLEATPDGIHINNQAWQDVFVARPCIPKKTTGHPFAGHESGGRLAQISENKLLVTIGDFEFDGVNGPDKATAFPGNQLGKTIEIDLDTGKAETFTSGHRNPQGLLVARDGTIWETEHGPHGGDELNILKRGLDYGWPKVSYGLNYGFPRRPWPVSTEQGRHAGYTKPLYAFMPCIGISNLVEVTGPEFPLWQGDLVVASLKDRALWRLRYDENRIVYSERIPVGARIRDIAELPSGELLLLTDNANLVLVRRKDTDTPTPALKPAITVSGYDAFEKTLDAEPQPADSPDHDPDFGRTLFQTRCAGCHTGTLGSTNGPPLQGVVGRHVGSVAGFPYSDALANAGGTWTRQRLLDFLSEPKRDFSGTNMPEIVLPYRMYDSIVDYLENHK